MRGLALHMRDAHTLAELGLSHTNLPITLHQGLSIAIGHSADDDAAKTTDSALGQTAAPTAHATGQPNATTAATGQTQGGQQGHPT